MIAAQSHRSSSVCDGLRGRNPPCGQPAESCQRDFRQSPGRAELTTDASEMPRDTRSRRPLAEIHPPPSCGANPAKKKCAKTTGKKRVAGKAASRTRKVQACGPPSSKDEQPVVAPRAVDSVSPAQPTAHSFVGEYEEAIKTHMSRLEDLHQIPNLHLNLVQREVSERERAVIIDWLVDVHWCLQLSSTTLQLAVYILDRVLCCREVYIDELELVSLAALSLAAKYEDGDYAPKIAKLLGFIDNDRTRKDFVTVEKAVLQCLEYKVGAPTALHFFRRLMLTAGASEQTIAIGHFILELGICHYSVCAFRPSEVAASAALLAIIIVEDIVCDESKSSTPIDQRIYSRSDAGNPTAQLGNCVHVLHQILCCSKNTVEQAVRQKYSKCRAFDIDEVDAIADELKPLFKFENH